jgi:hypothetical protein
MGEKLVLVLGGNLYGLVVLQIGDPGICCILRQRRHRFRGKQERTGKRQ